MGNPLFSAFGGMNPMMLLQQLKANPLGVLRQRGFNVPDDLSDPESIIQHLMNSGQISQDMYNTARQMSQQFRMK